jgi:hypothetical protein
MQRYKNFAVWHKGLAFFFVACATRSPAGSSHGLCKAHPQGLGGVLLHAFETWRGVLRVEARCVSSGSTACFESNHVLFRVESAWAANRKALWQRPFGGFASPLWPMRQRAREPGRRHEKYDWVINILSLFMKELLKDLVPLQSLSKFLNNVIIFYEFHFIHYRSADGYHLGFGGIRHCQAHRSALLQSGKG